MNLKFEEIKRSRQLYFTSGSLRRYTLRSEISNSWNRYKLFKGRNISYNQRLDSKDKEIKNKILDIRKEIEKHNYKIYMILDDKKIYFSTHKDNKKYYSTGGEISSRIKQDFTVFKYEHISTEYDEKFTHGFSIKKDDTYNFTIAIEGSMKDYSRDKLLNIKKIINNICIKDSSFEKKYDFLDFKNKYNEIINYKLPLLLIGKTGTGKYSFIKYLKDKYYSEYKIKCYKSSRIEDLEECFNLRQPTIVYLEKIELLSYENQKKLLKKIESKLVYNKQNNTCDDKGFVLFFSIGRKISDLRKKRLINEKLLTRLTMNKVEFDEIKNYDENFVWDLIENITLKQVSKEAKEIISKINWKNNFHDFKKFINYIEKNSNDNIVKLKDIPMAFFEKEIEISTIEEMEEKLILDTISEFEGNMSISAKSLGISRSTLYRKINKYGINVPK